MVIDFIRLLLRACLGLVAGRTRGQGNRRPLLAEVLCLFVRFLLKDSLRKGVPWLRSRQVSFSRWLAPSLPVTFSRVDAGGVPALQCLPQGVEAPERWIVYLHGGGYVTGSPESSRDTIARLALAADAAVLGIEYRLAPEAAFPAAHHDCLAATRQVMEQAGGASRVAMAGDSAGGALCVATLVALRDGGEALPAACVLLSPWVDPSAKGGSMVECAGSDILSQEVLDSWKDTYLQGADPGLPGINLLQATLTGLPPMLVQFGEAEMFRDQIQVLVSRLQAGGVEVSLAGYAGQFHVFQSFAGLLRQGREALQEAGGFLARHLKDLGVE